MAVANSKKAPGRPWKKGQSGNPKGRSKLSLDFKARCVAFMDAKGWDALEAVASNTLHQDFGRAVALVAAYAYGKPPQTLEHSGGLTLDLHVIYDNERPKS